MPHLNISCWKASLLLHRGHLAWWLPAALANLEEWDFRNRSFKVENKPGNAVAVEPSFATWSPDAKFSPWLQRHFLQANTTLAVSWPCSFPRWSPAYLRHLLTWPVLLAEAVKGSKEEGKPSRTEKTRQVERLEAGIYRTTNSCICCVAQVTS